MAEVSKSGTPSLATPVPCSAHRVGDNLYAGEALGAFDACYIASGGTVLKATGAAANAAAKVRGFAAAATASGEPVTLWTDVDVRYGAGLTPGAQLFLSGTTAGGLADAASTGGTQPVGFVIDATRVRLFAGRY